MNFSFSLLTPLETLRSLRESTLAAMLCLVAVLGGYLVLEPGIIHSQVYSQFTTTQVVTAEISFAAPANNVTMDTTIPGLTGGSANGATNVRVYTNNGLGYTMTMTASTSPAMQGNTLGGSIRDFSTTTTGWMATPSYNFTVNANDAGFGYTVKASTTSDVAQAFMDNGSVCNAGSNVTAGQCWIGASTTPRTIINRATPTAASGATSTIFLRTTINSNPSPAIPATTYVATTTLTATTN